MEEGFQRRDWSSLPSTLLVSIAKYLGVADIGRLPAVCGGWAWSLGRARTGWPPPPPPNRAIFVPLESPWLLLPNKDGDEAEYCDFLRLSLIGRDIPRIRISPLPEMAGRVCVGASPDGWIVTLDVLLNPRILNPLTREEFPLPSIYTVFPYEKISLIYSPDGTISGISFDGTKLSDWSLEMLQHRYVRKIILSSAPPLGIAFLIHRTVGRSQTHLSIARVGDLAWSPGLDHSKSTYYRGIEDVVYNQKDRKFYVVTSNAWVFVLDLDNYHWGSLQPPKESLLAVYSTEFSSGSNYLFFSPTTGNLFQVWRRVEHYTESQESRYLQGEIDPDYTFGDKSPLAREETVYIKVMKFNPRRYDGKNPDSCWLRINNLGDNAIFLGINHSMCLSTVDKPWLKRNCVYFTEDQIFGRMPSLKNYPRDGGIYDLRRKTFERFFPRDCKVNWPPPVWFMPARLQFIP